MFDRDEVGVLALRRAHYRDVAAIICCRLQAVRRRLPDGAGLQPGQEGYVQAAPAPDWLRLRPTAQRRWRSAFTRCAVPWHAGMWFTALLIAPFAIIGPRKRLDRRRVTKKDIF